MLVWLLVLALLVGAWLYIEFTPRDVDPDFIAHQASRGSTKLLGETEVYRSLVNEHGRALLGSMRPLNQFRFSHLWDDVGTFRVMHMNQAGSIRPVQNIKSLVSRVQRAISGYPIGCEIDISFTVGVEALVAYLAIVLSGRVARFPDMKAAVEAEEKEDGSTLEVSPAVLSQAAFRFAQGSSGIAVRQEDGRSTIVPIFGQPSGADASRDDENSPISSPIESNADAVRLGKLQLSQVDIGVAIAGQLTALGAQHRWSESDVVFMAPGPLTTYSIVTMLTALSAKSQLVFAELGPFMNATALLERVRPTVLVSDDVTMRTLVKHTDDFRALSWLEYGVRRARLAKGALTRRAMIPGFHTVRLIHTVAGADPYQWLDNSEIASLRVLTGRQIVHAFAPGDGIPLAQTVIGDYRSSKKLPGVVFGPPLPGLELKLHDGRLQVKIANHTEWNEVSEETDLNARLGRDGALYVPAKRVDFSDYYYYTGELK